MDDIQLYGVYEYKGKRYQVTKVSKDFRVKDPDSGVWHAAVEYSPLDEQGKDMTFVRQRNDFTRKFTFVEQR
jgi:hypothetical protein